MQWTEDHWLETALTRLVGSKYAAEYKQALFSLLRIAVKLLWEVEGDHAAAKALKDCGICNEDEYFRLLGAEDEKR